MTDKYQKSARCACCYNRAGPGYWDLGYWHPRPDPKCPRCLGSGEPQSLPERIKTPEFAAGVEHARRRLDLEDGLRHARDKWRERALEAETQIKIQRVFRRAWKTRAKDVEAKLSAWKETLVCAHSILSLVAYRNRQGPLTEENRTEMLRVANTCRMLYERES